MNVLARLIDAWLQVPRGLRALVPLAGFVALWWSSSREPDREPSTVFAVLLHNSMHIVAYACLAASIWLAWSRRPANSPVAFRSFGSWVVASAYGIVDEVHQSFVPGRDCSFADVLSDASGAAIAVLVLRAATGIAPVGGRAFAVALVAGAVGVALATFT